MAINRKFIIAWRNINGITGGLIAGPFLACLYDTIFRSLRDAPGRYMDVIEEQQHETTDH